MSAGERNAKGKPSDIVKHAKIDFVRIVCGYKNYGYSTFDWSDVTCKKCLKKKP